MDVDAIRNSPIGRVVPISGVDRGGAGYEHFAFLPDPLPSAVDLGGAAWLRVVEAEAALARLDESATRLPEPGLLVRPSLRREAQSTSALEGTFAPFEAVLESDVDLPRDAVSPQLREVLNYVTAATAGFGWVGEGRALTITLIGELQRLLVEGTSSGLGDAGRLRERQVVIGRSPTTPITECRYVPPPPGPQLRDGVEQWLGWVNDPPLGLPRVVRAALAHYQFESLHPFSDGNGRIGRLLIVLQLLRDGSLRQPMLVVSPWLEAHRAAYQDGMLELSRTGDWSSWVEFFAAGIADAATTTRTRITELTDFAAHAQKRVRDAGGRGVAERLAGELIGAPVLSASRVAREHDVTDQAALNALRRLADLGLVSERRRGRRLTFIAQGVVDILSR